MPQMKYIIIEDHCLLSPFVFSDREKHSDVAHRLLRDRSGAQVISAGFCYITTNKYPDGGTFSVYVCYGNSISLNLLSLPDDSNILNRYFGLIDD